jgi:hypothetical protein
MIWTFFKRSQFLGWKTVLGVPTEVFRGFILTLRTNIGVVPPFAHDHLYPGLFLHENLDSVFVLATRYELKNI